MPRPRITLHSFSSLDGRITGPFGESTVSLKACRLFRRIGFNDDPDVGFNFDGWIYGKNTSIDGFDNHQKPDLKANVHIPAGDFVIATGKKHYYIALDRRGVIGWQKNIAEYGNQTANVIEILTDQVSEAYRDFLRRKQIPYLIAGKEKIDLKLMLQKLQKNYGLKNLMLGGGGLLNWSFLEAGLIDEISIVMAPAVDGSTKSARLFNAGFTGKSRAIAFEPIKIRSYADGTLWLRYKPIRREDKKDAN